MYSREIFIAVTFLFISIQIKSVAQIDFKAKTPPKEIKDLYFLIGTWTYEVEFYNESGSVVKMMTRENFPFDISMEVDSIINGLYLEGGGQGSKGSNIGRSWFFYHEPQKKYYHVAIDNVGGFNVLGGNWHGNDLVLKDVIPMPHKNQWISWRMTYTNISKDSHEILLAYSLDDGKTWTSRNKQKAIRIVDYEK